MVRYTNLDELINDMQKEMKGKSKDDFAYGIFQIFINKLEKLPTVSIDETQNAIIKTAKWQVYEYEMESTFSYPCVSMPIATPASFRCPLCGRIEERQEPYCNCGAKMEPYK